MEQRVVIHYAAPEPWGKVLMIDATATLARQCCDEHQAG